MTAATHASPRGRRLVLPKQAVRGATRFVAESWAVASPLEWMLRGLLGLVVWLVLFGTVFSGFEERHSQSLLYAKFREQLASQTAPVGGAIPGGAPVALLSAPVAGIHALVAVEGTTPGALRAGPGHLATSPLPGQVGVSVLLGRSTTYGGPFGHLLSMRAGDEIDVTTGQGRMVFHVLGVRRPGDPQPAYNPGAARLMLVTAAGSGWRAGWAPDHAVYVDAELSGAKPTAAPAGRPVAVASAGLPMHGDSSVLTTLVLWLELLALAIGAIVWLRVRRGRPLAWVIGVPIGSAVLWQVTSTAAQLLPNLF